MLHQLFLCKLFCRADSYPFMSSIWPTAFACIAYVYFCKVLGPRYLIKFPLHTSLVCTSFGGIYSMYWVISWFGVLTLFIHLFLLQLWIIPFEFTAVDGMAHLIVLAAERLFMLWNYLLFDWFKIHILQHSWKNTIGLENILMTLFVYFCLEIIKRMRM